MGFPAKTIMTRQFVSIELDASADAAMELLLRHQISGLPVVDSQGNLKGVITEFDLLKLLFDTNQSASVADFLTRDVITVNEDDPLPAVAELFLSTTIRRVPVLREGKVVGIISRRDLIRYVHSIRQAVAQQLEARKQAHAGEKKLSEV